MNSYTWVFIAALASSLALRGWLAARQLRHVAAHRHAVPAPFAAHVDLIAHRKAADYTLANTRLGQAELIYGALIVLAWTYGGGLEALYRLFGGVGLGPLAQGCAFLLTTIVIGTLRDLPTTLYHTFVIEQRFGFNRTSPRLFWADMAKHMLLTVLLGGPLLAAVLWLMARAGAAWWVYAWGLWFGFSLLMVWAYPRFIAPWFNTFSPLTDAALRTRIEGLMARLGFASEGVFVMDGSRRSGHGNAYFTGFGRGKRVVFYDTLLKNLEAHELEAVLAHELGHYRLHHIPRHLAQAALLGAVGFALLGWLAADPDFYRGLGVGAPAPALALALFALIAPVFASFVQPLFSYLSRRDEFAADHFAARHTDAAALARALVKLYQDNAATLTPDPWHSAFHDSHPPAPLRVGRLLGTVS